MIGRESCQIMDIGIGALVSCRIFPCFYKEIFCYKMLVLFSEVSYEWKNSRFASMVVRNGP